MNSTRKLRKDILTVIEDNEPEDETLINQHRFKADLLGFFLSHRLTMVGLSLDQFALTVDIDREMAQAIVEGWFPATEISDGLLDEIALAVGYHPNILRILLGKTRISPQSISAST